MKLLYLACGGALGTLLRYGVAGLIFKSEKTILPWGTIAVNLVGCFVIGLLWALLEKVHVSVNLRAFLFIGVLGAFTTFSTYALETFIEAQYGGFRYALLNILISNVLGICAVWMGFSLVRTV